MFFKANLNIYLSKIFDDLYSNFSIFFFLGSRIFFETGGFMAANLFFNRLLTYTYWRHNYSFVLDATKKNKMRMRLNETSLGTDLLGFKIHCKGRFSRKQRASSIWYQEGKVPLNTLSSRIDYSFHTIPLRNSLCSIKV